MKLLFSEHKSDYPNYIFPYAIWAVPDDEETPADILAKGFLPASRNFERFYMCRHLRVKLDAFKPSSENRRIFRKGEGIEFSVIPRDDFDYNASRRRYYKRYADIKFGKDVMSSDRLDSLFNSKITSHLLVYTDTKSKKEIGTVTLYLEENRIAYYYYAFYDLNYYERNLGMYMMTSAVDHFAKQGYDFIYLGSCYSRNALYKSQFAGAEFFNGFRWSNNIAELKYLIKRDSNTVIKHLLETDEFLEQFYQNNIPKLADASLFRT